uniref:X-ray repair complementing defective repair in Chinese hamster cells 5 n=2 Tax=Cyprinus carpio TaxID=7962 RepID=A0A9R1SB51_CYPCA
MAQICCSSALVLCMDVGFSMSNSEPGQEPPFEQAKKVIQKFIQRQVFPENKDEVGVVLFGTDDTKNRLAKDGQYENITVLRHLMMPDFELLEDIESKLQPGGQQADCILPVTLQMEKKFERLNIVLLTDLNVQTSEDQLDIITENLKKAGITLQFFLPFPVDGEDRADGPGASARPGKGLSRQQTRGLEMVKHIMTSLEEEDGLEEVYTFSDALEKLSIFKCIDRRPMAWPCQLTIGGSLTIRIVRYKMALFVYISAFCTDVFCFVFLIIMYSDRCLFVCLMQIHLHQFMGSQVVKVFAPRDDEVSSSAINRSVIISNCDCLHHRGVNPDDPLPPIEPWLKRVIERPQDVSARCQAPLQDIKTKFPLKVVVKKKEQRTSADMFGSRFCCQRGGFDNHCFVTLIACQQLTHRIAQLLGNRSPEYYMKSVACIQAFRDQSVSVSSQLNLRIQSGICCGLLVMFLSAVWTLILTAPIHFVIPIIPNGDFQLNRFTLHLYLFFFSEPLRFVILMIFITFSLL